MRSKSYIVIGVMAIGISACNTDTRDAASETPAAAAESFASNESTKPAATAGTAAAQDTALPSTASPLALTAVMGLLSLGGALLVRHLR